LEDSMKLRTFALMTMTCALALPIALRANNDRLKSAADVLTEMAGMGDNGIPLNLLKSAKCIVIIPGVKKVGLGIGGQYGHGYINCRKAGGGWSAPGGVSVKGGSIGLQIGGASTDVIMVVKNDKGAEKLLSSKFTVGADGTVAAGPVGRQASAQTDATMHAEILAWSRSRGAFAGIALQGSTLTVDDTENKELYGKQPGDKALDNRAIVLNSTVAAPKAAAVLMAALAKY
jgi:lipid-binding SYLF domain-containing protein